eukprot:5792694-Prymnesium_polylepis.1
MVFSCQAKHSKAGNACESDEIWDGCHFWIKEQCFESCDECRGGKGVMHMELDLQVERNYEPACEPFRMPLIGFDEYEGDAPEWADFIKSAYKFKAAEKRPLADPRLRGT